MAEIVRKVDCFYIETPDKPGEGAKLLAALRDGGVNLVGFTAFQRGRWKAQIECIPENAVAFRAAARKAGLKLTARKTGFLIQGEDRLGAFADIMRQLAAANVNVKAGSAVYAGEGRYGAMLWVKPADVRKAAKVLAQQSGQLNPRSVKTEPIRDEPRGMLEAFSWAWSHNRSLKQLPPRS